MRDAPRISILLPVRNAQATLQECIDSLEAQTLRDWECLAVDDRSTDDSRRILEHWAGMDRRVRVLAIGNGEAGGIVEALERARAGATAPLLARQDADDRSLPGRFAAQVAAIEGESASGAPPAVVGCRVRRTGEGRATEGMERYLAWLDGCAEPESCAREAWIECPLVHPTAVMRADAIEDAGGYRDLGWPEDYDLWLRLVRRGARIMSLPETLYEWRDSGARLSRTDSRYSADSFLRCRVHHLRRWLAERGERRPIVVWGAGRDGRRLGRAWLAEAALPGPPAPDIAGFIDIDPRKIGRSRFGRPVLSPEDAFSRLEAAFVLTAVGVPGARARIRDRLALAGRVEGRDFLCLH